MKIKQLILVFGYRTLTELCTRKGWTIPSKEQVIAMRAEIEHAQVWVCDIPTDPADRETHGYVYDLERDTLVLTNKSFMEPVVVITAMDADGEVPEIEVDFDLLNYEYGLSLFLPRELLGKEDNDVGNNKNIGLGWVGSGGRDGCGGDRSV